ncbi:MAG: LLM class flavin-dependent oxidoreductase [Candidatus Dadabacteria bacterium]|nr:LLM class flavin-dependent oxidoreductase [Candidatus Dadabacteria bacterium]NIQ13479.1 LLM class flavin-dependent oxidoreductase [Candidatus Dadabacteria bacterium]
MDLGYFTMPLHPAGADLSETLEDDLQQIIFLDKIGFKEAWIGEHFTAGWENIPAPDLFLAKAGALTNNIILGTGVSCLSEHNPFILAHRIAVLDNLLKGRFYWGVGAGSFIGDFKAFEINPAIGEQRELMNDSLEFILNLWNNPKPGKYKNKRWNFTVPEPIEEVGLGVHAKPFQKPYPPIAVAGISENSGSLKTAGAREWIPMSINFVTKDVLKSHWNSVEEGAKSAGKTADRSKWRIARDIYVAETTEKARRDVIEGTLARDFRDYFFKIVPIIRGNLDLFKVDKSKSDEEVTMDYMIDNMWIVGSPEDVVNQIRNLYDFVGGFGTLLVMGHEWKPLDKWQNSMRLLVDEVIPKLNKT